MKLSHGSGAAVYEENEEALEDLGWQVLIVWECELDDDPVEAVEELADELDSQLDK